MIDVLYGLLCFVGHQHQKLAVLYGERRTAVANIRAVVDVLNNVDMVNAYFPQMLLLFPAQPNFADPFLSFLCTVFLFVTSYSRIPVPVLTFDR